MRKSLFIAVFAAISTISLLNVCAETVETVKHATTVELPELTHDDLLGVDGSLINDDLPAVSVPEPTAFGLIAFGLAVGGGLMVRRKH